MKLYRLFFAALQLMFINMTTAEGNRINPHKSFSFADAPLVSKTRQITYPNSKVINELPARGGATFYEGFDSMTIPADWVLVDVDGLIPSQGFFVEAWIALNDDLGTDNFVAASTSFYKPNGQADDWLITPEISLSDQSFLTWRARAPDVNFRDGYEVYISTTTQECGWVHSQSSRVCNSRRRKCRLCESRGKLSCGRIYESKYSCVLS